MPRAPPTTGRTPVDVSSDTLSVAMDDDGDVLLAVADEDPDYSYDDDGATTRFYAAAGGNDTPEYTLRPSVAESTRGLNAAADADGDYVVVWTEAYDYSYGPSRLYAQRFGVDGLPAGPTIEVSLSAYGETIPNAAVAADADGDFLVVWEAGGYDGSDGLWARSFDAAGHGGDPWQLVAPAAGDPADPAVAMDSDGDFVVGWSLYDHGAGGITIQVQQFNSTFAPAAPAFDVVPGGDGLPTHPTVAMDADGDFLVAWQVGYGQCQQQILGSIFDAGGALLAGEIPLVLPGPDDALSQPVAAMDADGDFVVIWSNYDSYNIAGSLYGQRFDGITGSAVAGDFNGDGRANAQDIDLLAEAIRTGSADPLYDVRVDGAVDAGDMDELVEVILGTHHGDADLDGAVDLNDFVILKQNFGTGAGWAAADFDGSGSVDLNDFVILKTNFGAAAAAGESVDMLADAGGGGHRRGS